MSPRRGWVLLPVLVCLGAAGLLLAGIQGERSTRERDLAQRQARIQGREFALGARALPAGASVVVGRWEVARAADGACRARGPLGTYRIAGGREGWEPAP